MRSVKLAGKEVVFFESIKEMSIVRHHEFQKLLLQDIGIGSDMDSVAAHFSNLHTLLGGGKHSEAMQEATNMHNNLFCMIDGINIKSMCFASLVHSIDGEEYELKEGYIEKVLKRVSKAQVGKLEEIIFEVKKNLTQNFNPSFLIEGETLQNTKLT